MNLIKKGEISLFTVAVLLTKGAALLIHYSGEDLTGASVGTQAVTSCLVLNASDNLTSDISDDGSCILINASSVTLDCAGFSITGNDTGFGVLAVGKSGLAIQNCKINNFSVGVNFTGVTSSAIINTTFTDNNMSVDMNGSTKITFTNDTFRNASTGVRVRRIGLLNITVNNSDFTNVTTGMLGSVISSGEAFIVDNSNFSRTGGVGIDSLGFMSSVKIMNSDFTSRFVGVRSTLCSGCLFENLKMDGTGEGGTAISYNLIKSTIINNITASNRDHGINANGSCGFGCGFGPMSGVKVVNSTFNNNNRSGIHLYQTYILSPAFYTSANISNNNFTNTTICVNLMHTTGTLIGRDNDFTDCSEMIRVVRSSLDLTDRTLRDVNTVITIFSGIIGAKINLTNLTIVGKGKGSALQFGSAGGSGSHTFRDIKILNYTAGFTVSGPLNEGPDNIFNNLTFYNVTYGFNLSTGGRLADVINNSDFTNTSIGIFGNSGEMRDLTITDSNFSNGRTGINGSGLRSRSILIKNSDFNGLKTAIKVGSCEGCWFQNLTMNGVGTGYGIKIFKVSGGGTRVYNNTARNHSYGFYVSGTCGFGCLALTPIFVVDNDFSNSSVTAVGIRSETYALAQSYTNNDVRRNNLSNSGICLDILRQSGGNITGDNEFRDCTDGIHYSGVSKGRLENVTLYNVSNDGIHVGTDGGGNSGGVLNNITIIGNSQYGIVLGKNTGGTHKNIDIINFSVGIQVNGPVYAVTSFTNITFRNEPFTLYGVNITAAGADFGGIWKNIDFSNTSIGVNGNGAAAGRSFTVQSSNFSYPGGKGIERLGTSNSFVVNGSDFTGRTKGISLSYCRFGTCKFDNLKFKGNKSDAMITIGVALSARFRNITADNYTVGINWTGPCGFGCSAATYGRSRFSNITLTNISGPAMSFSDAASLIGSLVIHNNTMKDVGSGILVRITKSNITDNFIQGIGAGNGLRLSGATINKINRNNITNFSKGISFTSVPITSNSIISNILENNSVGLDLFFATSSKINGNLFYNNSDTDVRSTTSSISNVFRNNTFGRNTTFVNYMTMSSGDFDVKNQSTLDVPIPLGKREIDLRLLRITRTAGAGTVKINISYNDTDVTDLVNESSFRIMRYNGTAWVSTGTGSVSPDNNVVAAILTTFSPFGIFGDVVQVRANKTDAADPVFKNLTSGTLLNYTISLRNLLNVSAKNVSIAERYSPNVTFVSAIPAPNISNNTWLLGEIPANSTKNITITVRVKADVTHNVTLFNTANLSYLNVTNETVITSMNENTTVEIPVLVTVLTSDSPEPVTVSDVAGAPVTYTFTVRNDGFGNITNITFLANYDENVTFVSSTIVPIANDSVFDLGTIPSSTNITFSITLLAKADLPTGVVLQQLFNLTFINRTGGSQLLSFNESTDLIRVIPPLGGGGGGGGGHSGDPISTCSDECYKEGKECVSSVMLGTCGYFDADPCLDFKTNLCADGRTCKIDECVRDELCYEEWICEDWGPCLDGTQERYCYDQNKCDSYKKKPETTQSCVVPVERKPEPEAKTAAFCGDNICNADETWLYCSDCLPKGWLCIWITILILLATFIIPFAVGWKRKEKKVKEFDFFKQQ